MSEPSETSRVLEEGDLFFFNRPRVGKAEVESLEDVQRLYMVMATQRADGRWFRMFVVGRKRLPDIQPGRADPNERNWAMVTLATSDPAEVRKELEEERYVTATRGERVVAAAKPVGEARYELVVHRDHTELAYTLELPEEPGPAQRELEIRNEASYVVAVRNPDIPSPPSMSGPRERPGYPERLAELFGGRRWISAEDVELLDYPHAQILMLGAREADVEEELGIHLEKEHESVHSAELFRLLRLRPAAVALEPLLEGTFPESEFPHASR